MSKLDWLSVIAMSTFIAFGVTNLHDDSGLNKKIEALQKRVSSAEMSVNNIRAVNYQQELYIQRQINRR